MTGVQTHHFEPTCFVDISSTTEQKRAAIYTHVCQNPDRFYPYHVKMEQERGSEAQFKRAEAFVVVREKLPKPCLPFSMGREVVAPHGRERSPSLGGMRLPRRLF